MQKINNLWIWVLNKKSVLKKPLKNSYINSHKKADSYQKIYLPIKLSGLEYYLKEVKRTRFSVSHALVNAVIALTD